MKTLLVGLLSALVCTGVLIGNSKLERRAREQASQDYQIAQAKAACSQKEPYYSKRLASYALASSALADVTVNAPVAKVRIALAALMTQHGWKGLLAQCERKPWGALRVITRCELQSLDAAITQVKVSVEVWHEDRKMVSL